MEQGRKEEHGGPTACAEEPPRHIGPGQLSAFQGCPPAAAEAARPQGGAAGRFSLLEMEEPLSVHGALSADWDLGPDLVSAIQSRQLPLQSIHPFHTGVALSIHGSHDV